MNLTGIPDDKLVRALADIQRLLADAPQVTWTKPDGASNTYLCLHADLVADWRERWTA